MCLRKHLALPFIYCIYWNIYMHIYLSVIRKWTLIHWCKNKYIKILGPSAMHWAIIKCFLPKMDNGNNTTRWLVSHGFASGTNFPLGIIPLLFWKDNATLLYCQLWPETINLLGIAFMLYLNYIVRAAFSQSRFLQCKHCVAPEVANLPWLIASVVMMMLMLMTINWDNP